jgi:hypothetical protein
VEDLALRVQDERRAGGAPLAGGRNMWQQRGSMRGSTRLRAGAVGRTLVVDARDGAEAVATAAKSSAEPDLLDPGYLVVGVGVAIERDGGPPNAVWVACLTRG